MLRQLGPLALAVLIPFTFVLPAAQAASAPTTVQAHPVIRLAEEPPGTPDRPRPPRDGRVLNVAHRGDSAQAPENTLAAFQAAADRGADLFELDVQETKDHKLVVVHDNTLGRTTNAERVLPGKSPWRVRDLTLAEIRRLDAGSWFGSKFKGQRIPTLAATLDAMRDSDLNLLLEVKSPSLYPGIAGRVASELRAHPDWVGSNRVIVQSFDWPFVRDFHRRMPEVPTGLLGTPSTSRLAAVSKYADYINPPYQDVTPGYISSVHKRGMRIIPWTVNDTATMRRLIREGADGMITNEPSTLRSVDGG